MPVVFCSRVLIGVRFGARSFASEPSGNSAIPTGVPQRVLVHWRGVDNDDADRHGGNANHPPVPSKDAGNVWIWHAQARELGMVKPAINLTTHYYATVAIAYRKKVGVGFGFEQGLFES
ncbi:hypothetical protein GGTG_13573 [Gaeumannomyces tritici R3-111a-1]|uniref:Uncharacterized protein n=1 Tax=Gaeumannomyces tritici (strain R3-111a-1) TaxID=644352 RepID=J3PJ92_GAET3|nr:hypothetical protein GGTG_13573 [Gaeumannomyces tritici R3-111a-1]EJT68864.1 hypothetical protein GGTG_13573 [Gaeumannomyces tritici R3-111a-1]